MPKIAKKKKNPAVKFLCNTVLLIITDFPLEKCSYEIPVFVNVYNFVTILSLMLLNFILITTLITGR